MKNQEIFVNKIPKRPIMPRSNQEDNQQTPQYYILKSEWRLNETKLQFVDLQQCKKYDGNISADEMRQPAEDLGISYEDFHKECQLALTSNCGIEKFQYLLDDTIPKFILTKKEHFTIQYLEVELKETKYEDSFNILDCAADMIAQLRSECSQKEEEKIKYRETVEAFENCIQEKNILEKNLLQKFAILLNSKKNKIAELKQLLTEKNETISSVESRFEQQNQQKRRPLDLSLLDAAESDDFLLPTQPMTQVAGIRLLPKRKKNIEAQDEVVMNDNSTLSKVAHVSTQRPIPNATEISQEKEIRINSENIFDLM